MLIRRRTRGVRGHMQILAVLGRTSVQPSPGVGLT
jgi:hypothetical protein